jgi:hypothetical protein
MENKKPAGPPPKECRVKGCKNELAYSIHLSLMVHPNHPPAITTPVGYTCEEHKSLTKFEDFSRDETWDSITKMFLSKGFMAPNKKFSKIIFNNYIDIELN